VIWPRSLFGRTAATFLALVLLFQLFIFSVSYFLILRPLLQASANDLAALIALSAERWVELPPEALPFYREELERNYQLRAMPAIGPLSGSASLLPFIAHLEASLSQRLGRAVVIRQSAAGDDFWVDVPTGTHTVRFGFRRARIGTNPSIAMLLLIASGVLLSLMAAVLVARRLTRPLAQLALSAGRVGRGETPEDLMESGPQELVSVARSFNRMTQQVRQLLQNRTTLLAGVSHDLRTPIARLRMAMELLRHRHDPALLDNMERYLDEMNALIAYFIEFTQGVAAERRDDVDMNELVEEIVASARAAEAALTWQPVPACVMSVPVLAVQRILRNFLDNALRYGAGREVEVRLVCEPARALIEVHDRGPGIPPDQRERVFQPFVRLEQSRNVRTGGAGLGLAIAWQIAQAQGWELVLLERAGGGTIARLVLPRQPVPAVEGRAGREVVEENGE
jgi:two-component system osmolarity sensor histidine kinase EnvZ